MANKMEKRMSELKIYTPLEIEPKWQLKWEQDGIYQANMDDTRPKHYALTMLWHPRMHVPAISA
jgi:leucyl-tRNA synthetase